MLIADKVLERRHLCYIWSLGMALMIKPNVTVTFLLLSAYLGVSVNIMLSRLLFGACRGVEAE